MSIKTLLIPLTVITDQYVLETGQVMGTPLGVLYLLLIYLGESSCYPLCLVCQVGTFYVQSGLKQLDKLDALAN